VKEVCCIQSPYFVNWAYEQVGERLPVERKWQKTIAQIDGLEVLAVVLYDCYNLVNIDMHIATNGRRDWLTKFFLWAAFDYPFNQLGVRRITAKPPSNYPAAIAFAKRVGFRQEGVLRCAAADGADVVVLGMLREECRFLKLRDRICQA
jgi:hypothetical protein